MQWGCYEETAFVCNKWQTSGKSNANRCFFGV